MRAVNTGMIILGGGLIKHHICNEQAAKTDMLSVVSIQLLCTVEGVANACI